MHYLDFSDDYLNKDGPHPSDNIPAVLAVCEAWHAGGASLTCGIVLAYEIVCQLVDSAEFYSRGWDYVTETAIGSALGAGKVLSLSREQMAQALALAIAPNISLRQTRVGELSMWKGCAGPNAARNGVFAALLAQEGMTGPDQAIEGACGLWNQVTGRFKLGPFGGEGRPFKIEDTFFKFRPVIYNALLPIETALELRKRVNVGNISTIKVSLDGYFASASSDPEKWDPHTRETADHSVPYLIVAAMVHGEISEETYMPQSYRNPQILALMQKLAIEEDPEFTREYPKTFHCRIEVTDGSGQKWTQHLKNPKGHPGNPMSDTDIEDKFLNLTSGILNAKQARAALHLLWHLEEVKDVSQILGAVIV